MTSLQSLYGSIHQCVKDIQEAAEPLEAVESLREESRRAVRVSRRIDVLILDAEPYLISGVQIWAALKVRLELQKHRVEWKRQVHA